MIFWLVLIAWLFILIVNKFAHDNPTASVVCRHAAVISCARGNKTDVPHRARTAATLNGYYRMRSFVIAKGIWTRTRPRTVTGLPTLHNVLFWEHPSGFGFYFSKTCPKITLCKVGLSHGGCAVFDVTVFDVPSLHIVKYESAAIDFLLWAYFCAAAGAPAGVANFKTHPQLVDGFDLMTRTASF